MLSASAMSQGHRSGCTGIVSPSGLGIWVNGEMSIIQAGRSSDAPKYTDHANQGHRATRQDDGLPRQQPEHKDSERQRQHDGQPDKRGAEQPRQLGAQETGGGRPPRPACTGRTIPPRSHRARVRRRPDVRCGHRITCRYRAQRGDDHVGPGSLYRWSCAAVAVPAAGGGMRYTSAPSAR